jgi:hypothetical protein
MSKSEIAARLPSHPEIERSILGAVIVDVDNVVLEAVKQVMSPSDFFVAAHRRIFSVMEDLAASGRPIELNMLCGFLVDDPEVRAAGGTPFIASLGDGVHRNAPVTHWARMVHDAAVLRRAAYAGESLTNAALEPHAKAEEVIQHAQILATSFGTSLGGIYGMLASEIQPEHVEWLWDGRIPLGKITILDGDPGLGKSALTLDITARITKGSPMPDGSAGVKGGVLVLNAEDDEADTIVPRLIAMDADLSQVRIMKTIPGSDGERQPEIPGDLSAVERAANSVHAKLIIIDPLMAFLASTTNSFRDQDIRRALAPLAIMCQRARAAALVVRHLNKNTEGNALYRGGGSIGIIGAARSGLLVARDPDDESGSSRILASTKSNLGPSTVSLRYSIQPHGMSIKVCWSGESAHHAAALLAVPGGEEGRTAVDEACEFLRTILEDGAMSAKDALRKGDAAGFGDRTIKRAKAIIGIKARRQGFGAGSTWVWELPPKSAKDGTIRPKSANPEKLASFGQATDSKPIESTSSPKSASEKELAPFAAIEEEL